MERVKSAATESRLERDVAERFGAVVPSGWAVTRSEQERVGGDLMFSVRAPDGLEVTFAVAVKRVVVSRE